MDLSKQVLLIDLENCPTKIQQLKVEVDQFIQIVICYTHSQAKIPLSWLNALATAITQNKLRMIQMTQSEKNATDFGLAFFAGVLMQELPVHTEFLIISNDKELDHIVHLLKSQNRAAQRIGTLTDGQLKPITHKHAKREDILSVCEALIKHHNNRPSTSDDLKSLMNRRLSQDVEATQSVFSVLVNKNVIAVQDGKVTYYETPLQNLMLSQG